MLEDTPYRYNLTATDPDLSTPDKDTLTFSLVQAPGWLQGKLVDKGNGTAVLSGTPTNADVGKHTVTIEVTDAGGLKNQETHTFVITVENANSLPTIDSLPVGSAVEEGNYGYCIHVTDLDPNEKFDFDQSAIPSWLEIVIPASNADCQSGTATAVLKNKDTLDDIHVGTHKITLVVKDSQGGLATQTFDLTVTNKEEPPVLDVTSCPEQAKEDEPYRCVVVATDEDNNRPGEKPQKLGFKIEPTPPTGWLTIVTNASLPYGTAVLSGTPPQPTGSSPDTHSFTITVDDGSNSASGQRQIAVENTPDPPIINVSKCLNSDGTPKSVAQGSTYNCLITIVEEDTDKMFTFTNILPDWLQFDLNSKTLSNKSGRPNNGDVGTHTVVIGGKDNDGLTATAAFMVTVTNANDNPAFAQLPTSPIGGNVIPAFLAPNGLITDPDASVADPPFSFDGGKLTVQFEGDRNGATLDIMANDGVLQIVPPTTETAGAIAFLGVEIGTYTQSNNDRSLVIDFNDQAKLEAATAVLQRIYLDYGNEPHTPRTITLQINDGAATADEKIIVGNTAPTLVDTAADIQAGGTTVNDILKLNTNSPIYSDDDEDAAGVDYYEPGIAITAASNDSATGTWQYCLASCHIANNWDSIAINNGDALHLNKDAQIRFNGTPDNGQTPSITFHAWDQSNGVANGASQAIPAWTASSAYSEMTKTANRQ